MSFTNYVIKSNNFKIHTSVDKIRDLFNKFNISWCVVEPDEFWRVNDDNEVYVRFWGDFDRDYKIHDNVNVGHFFDELRKHIDDNTTIMLCESYNYKANKMSSKLIDITSKGYKEVDLLDYYLTKERIENSFTNKLNTD